jgi:large subunit ribosomal protein L9
MPEAVLLQDVESLGERGKVVDVSKGYLRNYLIPRKLAALTTPGLMETIAQRERAAEQAKVNAVERSEENAALLNKTVLTLARQAGADGRLFGSVTGKDIADAVKAARGVTLEKGSVLMEEPIKNLGTYMVVVELPGDRTATIKTMVVAAGDK